MPLPLIPWSTGFYSYDCYGLLITHHSSSLMLQPSPPINNIPLELLGEIFTACLQVDPFFSHGPARDLVTVSPSNSIDPMTLAQVCRHWRAVALSMPTLWASMRIRSPCRGHLQLTRVWLERSRVCPLHLLLSQDSYRPSAVEQAIRDELIALLVTQCDRWRHINFHLTGKIPSALLNMSHRSLTQLVSANVFTSPMISEHSDLDSVWRLIHAAPTLRQVRWGHKYLASLPAHIPWMQLTGVSLNARVSTSVIFDLLHCCKRVVDLEVHIEENSSTPSTPVTLPYLRHLCIRSGCPLDPIFDQLTLPQISSLRLDICHGTITSEELSSLNYLLARSNDYLLKLFYNDFQRESTRTNILEMLRLPRLSRLNDLLIISRVGDEVFHALTWQPRRSQEHLLPELENLTIGDCRGTTSGVLGTMVSSRAVTHDGLMKLRFLEIFSWDIDTVDKEVLRRLSGDGLHMSVSYDE